MDPDKQKLEEMYRLEKDNNRMLHSMRRNAFWGGLFKFIFYILILVVAPLWIYTTYFAPIMKSMQDTIQKFQGTGASAQAQFGSLQEMWKTFESQFKSASSKQ